MSGVDLLVSLWFRMRIEPVEVLSRVHVLIGLLGCTDSKFVALQGRMCRDGKLGTLGSRGERWRYEYVF